MSRKIKKHDSERQMRTRVPHDELIVKYLSDPKHAKVLISNALDKELLDALDLDTLTQCTNDHIFGNLQKLRTDVLYHCQCMDKKNNAYFVLIEHKSSRNNKVLFQILIYMAVIWYDELANKKTKLKELPVIIPIIVYDGLKEWKMIKLRDVFKHSPYKESVPDFKVWFFDIGRSNLDDLERDLPDSDIFLYLKLLIKDRIQHAVDSSEGTKNANIHEILHWIYKIQKLYGNDIDAFKESLVNFLQMSRRADSKFISEVEEKLLEESEMETVFDRVEKRGIEKGRAEGRAEGKAEGMFEGMFTTLLDNLKALMQNLKCSLDEAMNALSLTPDMREKCRAALQPA